MLSNQRRVEDSIDFVSKYFDKNPDKLAVYIKSAMTRDVCIVGAQMIQLAIRTGIHPIVGKKKMDIPPYVWCKPNIFTNIDRMIFELENGTPVHRHTANWIH